MEFDNSKLIGRIIEKYDKQYVFARVLKVSEHTLCSWLKGKTQMNRSVILRMAELLDIPDAEIGIYFFPKKDQSA